MDLKGAELMTLGDPDGRGIHFTAADLQAIADSFAALNLVGRVPLKFGHNDEQPLTDGQPALGWVSKLWTDGVSLLADFSDIPKLVYDAIKAGAYKFVSVELLRNVQAGTRRLPWVLDAVALLGADQPAFGNLRDLQSLTLRRRPAWRSGAVVSFTRDKFSSHEGKEMDEAQVQALVDKAVKGVTETFTKQISDIEKKHGDELKTEQGARKADQIKYRRQQITDRFNREIAIGRMKPAAFERFKKLTKLDKDESIDSIEDAYVEEYIKESQEPVKLGRQPTSVGADPSATQDEAAEAGKSPAEVVNLRARKLCYGRNQDPKNFVHLTQAVADVLQEDPQLGEDYKLARQERTKVDA